MNLIWYWWALIALFWAGWAYIMLRILTGIIKTLYVLKYQIEARKNKK